MNEVYPLVFRPIPREKEFWGGMRMAELLGKPFAAGAKVGESWELSDYPGFESVVSDGPLAGTSIRRLVEQRTAQVVGDAAILQQGRFPLLAKYIDAGQTLSVQVHPGDEYARARDGGSGKQEAWYILHAEPGAKLIRGVTPGTTRAKFASAIASGHLDPRLKAFEPKVGDVVMIPTGMIHAIGAGIVLAEIQQVSDITYRVYDWNRVDEEGRSRELHVAKALDVIQFDSPASHVRELKLLEDGPSQRFEGVRCDKFVLEVLQIGGPFADAVPEGRFVILNVVDGDVAVEWPGGETRLPLGTTALIPAAMPPYKLVSNRATVLRSYVP